MDPVEREVALQQTLFPALPEFPIEPARTALVTIDMQYLDAHPDFGLGRKARERDAVALVEEYFDAVAEIVPRIQRLHEACRRGGIELIHVCISPYTTDARECPPVTRVMKIRPPKGTRETEILDELKPVGDEIVLGKITSSAFTSTPLNLILNNMGVDTLLVCGVITNGCVESTVRDGRDLGYKVIVVGDACATWTRDMHERALRFMSGSFANVRVTDQVLQAIDTLAAVAR
jgi:nicotinamidase-related amidase